jgi:hypothetical protein
MDSLDGIEIFLSIFFICRCARLCRTAILGKSKTSSFFREMDNTVEKLVIQVRS